MKKLGEVNLGLLPQVNTLASRDIEKELPEEVHRMGMLQVVIAEEAHRTGTLTEVTIMIHMMTQDIIMDMIRGIIRMPEGRDHDPGHLTTAEHLTLVVEDLDRRLPPMATAEEKEAQESPILVPAEIEDRDLQEGIMLLQGRGHPIVAVEENEGPESRM